MFDNSVATLREFLSYPVDSEDMVFNKFKSLDKCIHHVGMNIMEEFIYIPRTRADRVVMIAHADTVWHDMKANQILAEENGIFFTRSNDNGIGADDRAGCAILWELRDLGHSILITSGEEIGGIGAMFLVNEHPELHEELNSHQFMIEFDRRNSSDFKCYDVGTEEFRLFIEKKTGFSEPDNYIFTDICYLCKDICGVNVSTAYDDPHTSDEIVNIEEWLSNLKLFREVLSAPLPKFEIVKTSFSEEDYNDY